MHEATVPNEISMATNLMSLQLLVLGKGVPCPCFQQPGPSCPSRSYQAIVGGDVPYEVKHRPFHSSETHYPDTVAPSWACIRNACPPHVATISQPHIYCFPFSLAWKLPWLLSAYCSLWPRWYFGYSSGQGRNSLNLTWTARLRVFTVKHYVPLATMG